MTTLEVEERLTRLEAEALKQKRAAAAPAKKPWWEEICGTFKECPEYEEAMRLGREWRDSQRMEDEEDDATLTAKAQGSVTRVQ